MSPGRASILIVDDEVDNCRNLSDIFADLGYRADMAHDGRTALEKVQATRYDLAILDLMMPGMDGLALYQEIKRLRPETIAVLATAYSNHPRAEQSLDAGVWRLISKPVDLIKLISLVDEAAHQPVVLVVDDDRELCLNLWDIFRTRDYRVGIAHDVRSAVSQLQVAALQVVLIDMRLPDGDGSDVLRSALRLDSPPKTVLMTGHCLDLSPSEQLLAKGADAIFYKPFDLEELIATVNRLSKSTGSSPTSHP